MCSALFPPEEAAPSNSSPKRGLTCMHSPSPPDPRWSRLIACLSPPPARVVCSPPPLPERGCGGLRHRPAGDHRLSPARSAPSGSRWMAKIHFPPLPRYKTWEVGGSLSRGLSSLHPRSGAGKRAVFPPPRVSPHHPAPGQQQAAL